MILRLINRQKLPDGYQDEPWNGYGSIIPLHLMVNGLGRKYNSIIRSISNQI
jgi:hypothetical protein